MKKRIKCGSCGSAEVVFLKARILSEDTENNEIADVSETPGTRSLHRRRLSRVGICQECRASISDEDIYGGVGSGEVNGFMRINVDLLYNELLEIFGDHTPSREEFAGRFTKIYPAVYNLLKRIIASTILDEHVTGFLPHDSNEPPATFKTELTARRAYQKRPRSDVSDERVTCPTCDGRMFVARGVSLVPCETCVSGFISAKSAQSLEQKTCRNCQGRGYVMKPTKNETLAVKRCKECNVYASDAEARDTLMTSLSYENGPNLTRMLSDIMKKLHEMERRGLVHYREDSTYYVPPVFDAFEKAQSLQDCLDNLLDLPKKTLQEKARVRAKKKVK